MIAWRISRQRYALLALTGFGAAQRGGRWNSRGVPLVYASTSRALALLEILAHIDREQAPTDYEFTRLSIPDDAIAILESVPASWDAEPPPVDNRAIGEEWVRSLSGLALLVPSVIVPDDWNVVINPAHPRFEEIVVTMDGPVRIDPRLLEG